VLEIALAFLAGLFLGSFLNVCIYRLPRDLSVVRPARSFCPFCEKTIAWYDNVPLVSYLVLHGRCRQCGARIPVRYFLVEVLTGAAFAGCLVLFGITLDALKYSIFSAILITLIAADIEERILPDEFTLGGAVIGVILAYFVPLPPNLAHILLPLRLGQRWLSVGEAVLGGSLISLCIWLVGWVYQKVRHREGLGFGDVKMIAMIGAFLGLQGALLTLIAASLFGAIGGLIFIFFAGKDASTYELPFGSFLGMAALAIAIVAIGGFHLGG